MFEHLGTISATLIYKAYELAVKGKKMCRNPQEEKRKKQAKCKNDTNLSF